ncbi:hypothetical protein [Arthrobacter glacialis]|uniref:hypothetical protein n=1 Tax=Arthrobacter glacialis TaxID=1664 RepID=UPI000CD3D7D3|nr:hypothetical protein [Arthrobacter glacialis]POH58892.1 hypothetical protein CVS28_09290 [Arthrobacter glacialis]
MSTELKELEGRVVFKDPLPGDRKKVVEPMFTAKFRTARELRVIVEDWAKGQWNLMAGIVVEIRKPDKRHKLWRAEVVLRHETLAEVVFWSPRVAAAPAPEALFP